MTTDAQRRIDVQGHRGARGHAPENTLAGFRRALAMGVTTLELDVVLSADGVPMVHHDEGLNVDLARRDGTWIESPEPLAELTRDALRAVDVGRIRPGSEYGSRFASQQPVDGEPIPTLAEVFATAEPRNAAIRYNVEAKLGPEHPDPEGVVAAILAVVREAGGAARTTIQSFDFRAVIAAKERAPEVDRACLTVESDDEDTVQRGASPSPWHAGFDIEEHRTVPRLVRAVGCTVWSPLDANLTETNVAEAHALGLRVVPWTVNEPAAIDRALDLGVDGIISDYPDRVRAALSARGWPLPPASP